MKNIHVTLLLFISLSLSSCLTIVEEITIRKDGSGTYSFALDGSKVKSKFDNFGKSMGKSTQPDTSVLAGLPDTVNVLEKKEEKYEIAARLLANKNGISNAHGFNDTLTHQSGFAFNFQSLAHLQDALISLKDDDVEIGGWNEDAYIGLDGKTLKRHAGASSFADFLTEIMTKQSSDDEITPDANAVKSMMKMMFRDLEFKTIYHFPDQKIKKCNDKNAQLSDDRHTLIILEKPLDENNKSKKKPSELNIRLK
ncbi:MAG TPA: hypothetical protein VK168_04265 [Saprospiraceae bacterium]|nr:hypothetical protein [Saprospiraceae bacterium]